MMLMKLDEKLFLPVFFFHLNDSNSKVILDQELPVTFSTGNYHF